MANKSEGIDILSLYTQSNYIEWNRFLTEARAKHDVAGLVDVLRRLEMGMSNLESQKLNTDKICQFFLRLQRSIEITIREIHRTINPNPLFNAADKSLHAQHMADKKRKQHDLELFLKKVRY